MTDKLSVYNIAAHHLGERALSSLSEEGKLRRVLDSFWDSAVRFLHEQAYFNWSIAAVQWEPSDDVEPLFGWTYVYQYPVDYIRTVAISYDQYFNSPCERFELDSGYLHADMSPLYMRYVSGSTSYMLNIGAWTEAFAEALGAYLAFKACQPIKGNKSDVGDMYSIFQKQFKTAKSCDAMNEPTRYMPPGTWARARRGFRGYRGRWYERL